MRNGNPGKGPVSTAAQNGHIRFHSLRFASQLELEPGQGDAFQLVHGHARATQVRVPAGWPSLCVPLSGGLQLQTAEGEWQVCAGRLQVWRDGELRIGNRGADGWLLLTAAPAVWARHLRGLCGDAHAELFPGQHDCSRGLRRLLVRLARTQRRAGLGDACTVLEALLLELLACQGRDLDPHLARCSGRTPMRRQQTLLRLMRVRMLIEICRDHRLDMARLARSASYSPWHLIRMYRDVFGETPSEHAQRLRMLRAWTLVRDTRLPICEITEALGFESQSSFCRAFRQAYGTTTGDVRRLREAAEGYDPPDRAPAARAA
ncbi:MAG TPA: AraC family transcriptional regulator [Xanthomonadaceae bacterium]|nr:AraC family transcriptional regulator [Xanthomonadaceae bacterium]